MSKFDVGFTIPEKEPYEGKATQKQKQYIWNLGFQDQSIIDELGKKQASALIDQLKTAYERHSRAVSGIWRMILSAIGLVVCVITAVRSDSSIAVAIAYFFGAVAVIAFLDGGIRTAWNRHLLSRS